MRRVAFLACILASATARANGALLEGDVGLAAPVGDDDYDRSVDTSVKFGVRLGTATRFGGLDLGIDFTPYSDALSNQLIDVAIQRWRFMSGGRYVHPVTPKARIFVRAAGGVDVIHYNTSGSVFGIAVDNSQTDAGIALEIAGGVLFDVGKVSIGAKLGIPLGFHFHDDDPNDPNDADLSYTAVDVDFAFVVAVPF